MDFITDCDDFGAPEINVLGISRIERISEAQIRVSYYTRRNGGHVVVAHLIWDLNRILDCGCRPFEELRAALLNHALEEDGREGEPKPLAN